MPPKPIAFGYFGKYPFRGDFVGTGLIQSTVMAMDAWATAGMSALRDASVGSFTEVYAAAPLWRFATCAGVFGETGTAGVMAGGVDAVGRPFPFFAGGSNLANIDPYTTLKSSNEWFIKLEDAIVALFDGSLGIESFILEFSGVDFISDIEGGNRNQIVFATEDRHLGQGCLLDDNLFCQLFGLEA
jgi:type VI secretion system ImpM family protein